MKRITTGAMLIVVACLAAAFGAGFAIYLRPALASRNASGTYSTPNTFVSGTTISSSAMNANFSDIATEMTASLERSGKGGMLAALRGVDGTVAAPAFSYTSETGSGEYRIGSGDLGWAVSGTKKLELTSSLFTVVPNVAFSGFVSGNLGIGVAPTTALHVLKGGSSGATPNSGSAVVVEQNTTNFLSLLAPNANSTAIIFGDVANASRGQIQYYNSAHGSADQMQFGTNGTIRTVISNSGLTIGASGTAISASFRGTVSWTPGSLVGVCATNTITLTGAAAGADCVVTAPGALGQDTILSCRVTADTCNLNVCVVATFTQTPPAGTYACRVFNP